MINCNCERDYFKSEAFWFYWSQLRLFLTFVLQFFKKKKNWPYISLYSIIYSLVNSGEVSISWSSQIDNISWIRDVYCMCVRHGEETFYIKKGRMRQTLLTKALCPKHWANLHFPAILVIMWLLSSWYGILAKDPGMLGKTEGRRIRGWQRMRW